MLMEMLPDGGLSADGISHAQVGSVTTTAYLETHRVCLPVQSQPMRYLALLNLALAVPLAAQWTIQDSHTTADLRGIFSVGGGVAWASGTRGTILRTVDSGSVWQLCVTPPDAQDLDFRGIQAFDENTAIVMSTGKGKSSRLYKTTDGCKSWRLLFTNPDPEGSWDAISMNAPNYDALGHKLDHTHAWGTLLGNPVNGSFAVFRTDDGGETWHRRLPESRGPKSDGCRVDSFQSVDGEAAFAMSNQSILTFRGTAFLFITGGQATRLGFTDLFSMDGPFCHDSAHFAKLPLSHGRAGAFGMAATSLEGKAENFPDRIMVVGGDPEHPDAPNGIAVLIRHPESAFRSYVKPNVPPHGYRSAVAYDQAHDAWITVGPNGTDLSTDDGRNWVTLQSNPTVRGPQNAEQNWNSLALPFAVGPHGRIGKLEEGVLTAR